MAAKSNYFTRYASIIKWLVALFVLFFLFKRVDTAKVLSAMAHARMDLYLPLAVVFVIIWFLIEAQNLMFLFNLFGHGIRFRDMRIIRGSSYLLMIINYNLGLGAMAWYLKKRNGIPLLKASSVMFFYYFVESVGITLFAMGGCLLILSENPPLYTKIVWIAGSMGASYIILFFMVRLMPARGFFGRIRNNPLFSALHEATFSGFFKLSGLRAVYFAAFIVFFYFGLQCFHVHVPVLSLIGLVPVIFFIGNIPVTPFGLGTIQAAMLFFFKPYGAEEHILSFSVVYSATLLFLRAPIGLIYMGKSGTDFKDITNIDIQKA